MGKKGRKKKSSLGRQGFTLMELLVVIGIIAIIATIALPGLLSMRARYQLRSSATDVLSALKQARSEAVKRNAPVAITFTSSTSYMVFLDDGRGAGGVEADKIQNGTEPTLSTSTLTTDSIGTNTFATLPENPEFASSGMLANACQAGAGPGPPFVPCHSIEIDGPPSLKLTYRITFSITGAMELQDSTDGGASWQ